MIPRLLVPRDVRPPAATPATPPRRLTTLLDNRELVPSNWPHNPLDTHSTIPAHMPLDVLAARTLVPRDTPHTPLDAASLHPDYEPVTVLDQRYTVPAALPFVELHSKGVVSSYELPDVLEPDVLNTGEANLMVEQVEAPPKNWNWKGLMWAASISVHFLFLLFLILQPKLFPYVPPTQEQIDMARQQLTFMPNARELPRAPAAPAGPAVRVDPRVLRNIAPMKPAIQPPAAPEQAQRETPTEPPPEVPAMPKPQPQSPQSFLRPQEAQVQPAPQPQTQTPPPNGLVLPRMSSPGRALDDDALQALHGGGGGGGSAQFGGRVPGGGGGGGGFGAGGVQMLTPTEGVDFSGYLARVVASVKQNWYAIMPESVYLGDKGRVVLQFRIMRNGGVPDQEPSLMSGSGKDPLDRAASSAIRTSSPFEPLPSAFSGPYIELRFIFLYNLPLNDQ